MPLSCGTDMDGTSARNEKSSSPNSRSLASPAASEGLGVADLRPNRPQKRETADGPPGPGEADGAGETFPLGEA